MLNLIPFEFDYFHFCKFHIVKQNDRNGQNSQSPQWKHLVVFVFNTVYCQALITVTPCCHGFLNSWLTNFKRFKVASVRLTFKTSKRTHVLPLLAKLHCLPIAQRIDYKMSSLCYDVVSDTAQLYLSDLRRLCVPSRSPRSSADTHIFRIPKRKKKFQGQCAFSHLGPVTWNKFSYSVRHAEAQSHFKTQLKTTLFHSVSEPDT